MAGKKEAIEIYKERDFYVPYFEIYIMNKKLEKSITNDILSLTYKDSLKDIDSVELTINNWDEENYDFLFINNDKELQFYPGQDIEVYMGYIYKGKKELKKMFYGEIITLEPDFPGSGPPTLKVRGLNILHRLRTKQRSNSYKGYDSEIAKKIAKRIGIDIKVKKGYTSSEENHKEYIFQHNQYDIVFLLERARTIGYELYYDPVIKKLVFERSEKADTAYKLEWGKSLINFRPTLTTANQVTEVVVIGWNPRRKKKIVGKAKRKNLETRALGVKKNIKLIEKSLAKRVEIVANIPVYSKREADRLAKKILYNNSKSMVKASGSTVGLPDLRSGIYLEIGGLGDIFSGRYYVTETTHTIGGSGYTTNFSARREEKSLKGRPK